MALLVRTKLLNGQYSLLMAPISFSHGPSQIEPRQTRGRDAFEDQRGHGSKRILGQPSGETTTRKTIAAMKIRTSRSTSELSVASVCFSRDGGGGGGRGGLGGGGFGLASIIAIPRAGVQHQ